MIALPTTKANRPQKLARLTRKCGQFVLGLGGVVVVTVGLGGCGIASGQDGRQRVPTGRDELTYCEAWGGATSLAEPSVESRAELQEWADDFRAFVGSINEDVDLNDEPLPVKVVTDLRTVEDEVERMVRGLESGGDARVEAARLARGPFTAISSRLTEFLFKTVQEAESESC